MYWTDTIQALVAIASLLVSIGGYLMLYVTLKLQTSTLIEQQKITNLESIKTTLIYKPWFVFIDFKNLDYHHDGNKFLLNFQLKNANARKLIIRIGKLNKNVSLKYEPYDFDLLLSDKIVHIWVELEGYSIKNNEQPNAYLHFYFEYFDFLDNHYEEEIRYNFVNSENGFKVYEPKKIPH